MSAVRDDAGAHSPGAGVVKLHCVWPAHSFSTYDVARGLFGALRADGHEVVDYALARRLQMIQPGLQALAPPGDTPDTDMVALHASEPLVYRTVVEGCRWVLVVSGMGLHPNALYALRRIGVKVAVVFTESPYDTHEAGELPMAALCDLAFTNERTSVPAFQAVLDQAGNGGCAVYLPHAYDPAIHRPVGPDDPPLRPEDRCDVLFVGTGFAERQTLLEAINWDGIDLCLGGFYPGIEGYGGPHRLAAAIKHGPLDNRHVVRLYHGAKIVLNPHRFAEGAESANPRVYEVAACGAFQISDTRAEVTELLGDAVPTYPPGVPWRLEALIREYLADEAGRRESAVFAHSLIQGQTFAERARVITEAIEQHDRARRAAAA